MKKHAKRRKWILAAVAILLLAGAGAAATMLGGGIEADTESVDRGDVVRNLKETGTVDARNTAEVLSVLTGTIARLSVEEGMVVQTGDRLLEFDATAAGYDLKSLQADLAGVQALARQATDRAERVRLLYEQGAVSLEEFEAAQAAARELRTRSSSLDYTIRSFSESTGTAGVKAPISGTVTGLYVKEGESVLTGSVLLEITDMDDVFIRVELVAEDADRVGENAKARVLQESSKFDAGGSVKKVHLKARESVSDLGIVQKRVTVEIEAPGIRDLRLGSDVDVEIELDRADAVLRVPKRAVFREGGQDRVFLVEAGKAVLRDVTLGMEGDDHYEVVDGLSEMDIVILSPGNDIVEGVKILE